ncbi:MAG TPA: hypothetical protein VFS39_04550 [Nitrospira sp.]|nr:hypothetical protein [Nitrospira sp.]
MSERRMATFMIAVGVGALVSAVVSVIGNPFAAKAQEAKHYQYRIVEVLHDTDSMQRTLNEFGSGGWELVAVSAGDMTSPRLIFKK